MIVMRYHFSGGICLLENTSVTRHIIYIHTHTYIYIYICGLVMRLNMNCSSESVFCLCLSFYVWTKLKYYLLF